MIDPRTPVLVGVGQLTVRDGEPLEPLGLMEAAARAAGQDAGAPALLEKLQSVAVVDAISQPLGDPGALLAERLGSQPAETVRSGLGGNGPQALVNDLCTRIARDGLDVALIAGAEAMATLTRLMKRGEQPPWPQSDGCLASRVIDDGRDGSSDAENAAGLIAPIFLYPVFEHALRGAAGRTREEHLRAISELWAHFSGVAAGNPHAWSREARTADELATASDGNRRVSDPYLKLHNSHIGVDQGAALLLCSAEAADAAGVPREEWVFPWAGAQAHDHWFATERDELHRSPAIRLAGEAVLDGVTSLDHVDLYSCFPSAVQIAARELGLGLDRPLTVTGGLTFAGGPGNNYATHGIAALAGRLRAEPEAVGLSTALGWYATKHALGVYSCRAPERPFAAHDVQDAVDALPSREVAAGYSGEAAVESYTALYERDGRPGMGIVVARLADGRRTAVKSHDADALSELVDGEDPLGRTVRVTAPEGIAFT
ncbi:MAG: acetyl-CoA acetyltransferase [Solirubrobacteraceae bacterium]